MRECNWFPLTELNHFLNGLNRCSPGTCGYWGLAPGVSVGERRVAGFAQRPMNVNALEWSIPVPWGSRGGCEGWNQFSLSPSTSRPTLIPLLVFVFHVWHSRPLTYRSSKRALYVRHLEWTLTPCVESYATLRRRESSLHHDSRDKVSKWENIILR